MNDFQVHLKVYWYSSDILSKTSAMYCIGQKKMLNKKKERLSLIMSPMSEFSEALQMQGT